MSSVVIPVKLAPSGFKEPRVNIIEKTDAEIRTIADPLWHDLVRHSNEGKYGEFVKNFSNSFALAMNQVVAATSSPTVNWREACLRTSTRSASSAGANM